MKSKQRKKNETVKTTENKTKEWKIVFYKTENGKCPVYDFMKTLTENEKAEMLDKIEYLRIHGNNIRRPRADYLRDKIYELRMTLTTNETRTLYFFFNNNEIVLTHAFYKKTQSVPESEINKAIKYKNDFTQRYNKENINANKQ
jgi:phage-related protein